MNIRDFWNEYWTDRVQQPSAFKKQVWKYEGSYVPRDLHPRVDGQMCYQYSYDDGKNTRTIRIIPVEDFWP